MRSHAAQPSLKALFLVQFLLSFSGCFDLLGSSWEPESTITVFIEPDPQGLGREEDIREGIGRWTNRLREKGIELHVQAAGEKEAEANVRYTWWSLSNGWGEWRVGTDGYVETGLVYLPAQNDQSCPQFVRNLAEHEMLHVTGIPDVPDGTITNTNQSCRFRTWSQRDEAVWDAFYPRSCSVLRATWVGEPVALQPASSLAHLGPSIATDEKGTWVAAWVDRMKTTDESTCRNLLLISRSTDLGITWSGPANLGQVTGWVVTTSLSTDREGHWLAIWCSDVSQNDHALFQARSDDNGVSWSAPQAVVDRVDCVGQGVATDGSTWGMTWVQGGKVAIAKSTNAGQTWGEPLIIAGQSVIEAGVSWDGNVEDGPHLAISPTGTWLIAWTGGQERKDRSTSGGSIYACRSTDGGVTWNMPVLVHSGYDGQGWASRVRVSTDGAGNWGMISDAQAACPDSCQADVNFVLRTSSDEARTWSAPQVLENVNTWPDLDILADGHGQWVVAGLGSEKPVSDAIRLVVGTEHGAVWGLPETVGLSYDGCRQVRLATDRQGNWVCLGVGADPPRAIPFRVRTGL